MKRNAIALALFVIALPLAAQTAHEDLTALQDNSFLLEEAYNQDPGVVQHIGAFSRANADEWELSFAQEWPLLSQRHQLSYDIGLSGDGFGDVAVHYRYQLIGDGGTDLAISPRFSVILPTGDDGEETGVSIGLPISRVLRPRLAWHTNLDLTWQDGTAWTIGQSLVYALSPRVQAHAEAVYSDGELVFAPGVRWSHDRPGGLQIVPGVAAVFGEHEDALLLYLSFEHPFRR